MAQITSHFFSPRFDGRRQDRDIEQHQRAFGTIVQWYFFDSTNSVFDDVYDEGNAAPGIGGRRWNGPHPMPVVSANRREGAKPSTDDGRYVVDTIDLRISYEQARRVGMKPEISQNHEAHLNDRFIYDNRVFEIKDISVTGQFDPSGLDVMLRVLGTQIRPDELVNDLDFQKWA